MHNVELEYNKLIATACPPSDISEHLPTLKAYAEDCEHVTEMGVRTVVSSYAFAVAKPKTYVSIDFVHPSEFGSEVANRLNDISDYCSKNDINFTFIVGDTTKITIQPTDLLFIDTLHCYGQLTKELKLHADKVKKYLIFHDTDQLTYGFTDDYTISNPNILPDPSLYVEGKVGLVAAINDFLNEHPEWKMHKIYSNCCGITVLKRVGA